MSTRYIPAHHQIECDAFVRNALCHRSFAGESHIDAAVGAREVGWYVPNAVLALCPRCQKENL